MDSILKSVKTLLGGEAEQEYFDQELIMWINMGLNTLTQLGVGPKEGFRITGEEETLQDFLGVDDPRFEMVKNYLFLRTKVMFDNSTLNSYVISAIQDEIKQLEWRLNVQVDPVETFE